MAIILHIDTAVENASICLATEEEILGFDRNDDPRGHSSWLHQAILDTCQKARITLNDLDAVAVTIGPGSYTGLRVGLSAAKGICFSLGKPLIAINTLELIASGVNEPTAKYICPMIDARRMEVFTALYSIKLEQVMAPGALVLDEGSFSERLEEGRVVFAGNGAVKFRKIISHPNAVFTDGMPSADKMRTLAFDAFRHKKFSDVAYTEPLYVKEFYNNKQH